MSYVFDETGMLAENVVTGMFQINTVPVDASAVHYVSIPSAPFYGINAALYKLDEFGNRQRLDFGDSKDYILGHSPQEGLEHLALPTYGSFIILDNTATGTYEYEIHVVGGTTYMADFGALRVGAGLLDDVMNLTWENITGKLTEWPPSDHNQGLDTVEGIEALTEAVSQGFTSLVPPSDFTMADMADFKSGLVDPLLLTLSGIRSELQAKRLLSKSVTEETTAHRADGTFSLGTSPSNTWLTIPGLTMTVSASGRYKYTFSPYCKPNWTNGDSITNEVHFRWLRRGNPINHSAGKSGIVNLSAGDTITFQAYFSAPITAAAFDDTFGNTTFILEEL